LEQLLSENIIPAKKYSIEYRWSGIMGVGKTRNPIIQSIDKDLFCAVRMGGMGVAIGSLAGKEVANLVLTSLA
jgi:glycine/D-amino acid oxidase-like deaminating enzyme